MKNFFILIIYALLLLTGCGPESDAQRDDASDEKDARVRSGLEMVQQKNWDQAIQQFDAALTKNPELARPDLELALIYHQQKKNYIRAVYHYERYLEKRPLTEKRLLIHGWIKQAKISLAGEIDGAGAAVSEELVRLTRENNLLRRQLEAAAHTAPVPAASVKTILPDPPPRIAQEPAAEPLKAETPAPQPVSVRTYQVRPGDTLMRISGSVYGDISKWRKIYEANRDRMKNESDIKAGQTLIIPDL